MRQSYRASNTYPGGKGAEGVFQSIINQLPPHRVYIEPFAGAATIARIKRPADHTLLYELDPVCAAALRARPDLPPRTRVNEGHAVGDGFAALRAGLAGKGALAEFVHEPDTVIYLDPPYLLDARQSKQLIYTCEFETAEAHRELIALIRQLHCRVALSGYTHPLYALALSDWRLHTFQGLTRRGRTEECLWCNYPEPTALHDYAWLGADHRERERIRRKLTRLQKKLMLLPALERAALLDAAAQAHHTATVAETPPPPPTSKRRPLKR